MICDNCNEELVKARIRSGGIQYAGGFDLFLAEPTKKGVFQEESRSSVSCYVCRKCGHIKLIADSPENLFK